MVQLKAHSILAGAYGVVAVVAAACTSDLLVDDFSSSFTTNRNNLGSWTSGKIPQIHRERPKLRVELPMDLHKTAVQSLK
ncbi:hypothetical protein BDP67DRAFT_530531 [Colletotrichum lupini]|nr:hypothetical protein BDP67DRAFT_530531 [Colletotrichum lupini]